MGINGMKTSLVAIAGILLASSVAAQQPTLPIPAPTPQADSTLIGLDRIVAVVGV